MAIRYIKQDWAAIVQLESLSSLGRPPALLFLKCPLQVTLNLLEVEAVPMVACHLKECVRDCKNTERGTAAGLTHCYCIEDLLEQQEITLTTREGLKESKKGQRKTGAER